MGIRELRDTLTQAIRRVRGATWMQIRIPGRPACISPAVAASTLATMNAPIRIRSTLIPAARAASRLPPIAYIARPTRW